MHDDVKPETGAEGLRIAIVVSRYHESITSAMREGAIDAYLAAGGGRDDLLGVPVPGSFELTAVCSELANSGQFEAIVAIGCVITGETTHDQYICTAVANGLTNITIATGVPIGFGVLTCQTMEQARARAGGGHGNKGAEAMNAAIAAARALQWVRDQAMAPGGRD